ncbi:Hypothetical protein, putative [Bodo saltans]|uniref:Uncharacterized protein n=1 Tax=Bodo saltans TaxID=75058 RepID=A0A0S4IZ10_BODSA|nr:Hypothetical protein, putative [Bodo saltans]|eukprot:CUG26054.1 Hypothetical protein, putative [Bodo saltans]
MSVQTDDVSFVSFPIEDVVLRLGNPPRSIVSSIATSCTAVAARVTFTDASALSLRMRASLTAQRLATATPTMHSRRTLKARSSRYSVMQHTEHNGAPCCQQSCCAHLVVISATTTAVEAAVNCHSAAAPRNTPLPTAMHET